MTQSLKGCSEKASGQSAIPSEHENTVHKVARFSNAISLSN